MVSELFGWGRSRACVCLCAPLHHHRYAVVGSPTIDMERRGLRRAFRGPGLVGRGAGRWASNLPAQFTSLLGAGRLL